MGVQQGDCTPPVILLFLVIEFYETLEEECTKKDLHILTMNRRSNSPRDSGKIIIHNSKKFTKVLLFELLCILYVDDGAFTFESREQLICGYTLTFSHLL